MKKIVCIALAAVMLVACFAGCSNDTAGGNTKFKLGGTGPLTGGAAIYGQAAQNGAQIAVDEINALGGEIQFELKYEDDEHDAEKAVNAYNALKDWGMQISLGSVTSTPGEVTSAEIYSDRIFALTPSASSTAVIDGKDNMYQMCFTDPNQGLASAQYIADKGLGEKIAVIYKNDDVYSKGIYETFAAKAAELNLEIVSTTTFSTSSDKDFNVQLTEAKNAGADLIFLPIYYTPASLILQQAAAMDYAPKFFGVDGMDGILTIEGFDTSLAEGVMLLTPFNADSTDAKTVAFVTKYEDTYGVTPNQFAADAYDAVYALYEAIKIAGATPDMSSSDICDKLIAVFPTIVDENGNVTQQGLVLNGLTGDGEGITWDATGAVSKAPKGMVIQGGAYVGMD